MDNNLQAPKETDKPNFIPPRVTGAISLMLKNKMFDHPMVKKFLEDKKAYDEEYQKFLKSLPETKEVELPELKPIDIESLYQVFKEAYKHFRGIEFNEKLNRRPENKYGESAILARTICAYLTKNKSFYNSPILNKKCNTPDLNKGIMIIGTMGTGKTSVMKTFYDMFLFSGNNPLGVQDVEENMQYLRRYKLGFKFYNTHEVVQDYHHSAKEHQDIFWKKHKTGLSYYDDLMTEKLAFGKDELFREILETKYNNDTPVILSMNYSQKEDVENLETTLDAYAARYGERLYDRAFSQFNFLELRGKSLRK